MRTIGEIIEAARSGQRPDYDELRLAVCAMDILMTFDWTAMSKLAEAEAAGKKPFLTSSAVWQRDESFGRTKRAMGKTPREFLGPNHDPDRPEVQQQRQQMIKLANKIIEKKRNTE